MIIDFVGCTHGYFPKLDGGDLLIVTGDLTARDIDKEHLEFIEWFACEQKEKYKKIIYIAGNHDNFLFDKKRYGEIKTPNQWNIEYLCDSGTEFEGLKIWGIPWTKTFKGMNPKCKAFTVDTEDELMDKFEKIPHDVDILITHGPAYGILDEIPIEDGSAFHAGSVALYYWFKYVARPKIHVCSHIHEAYGEKEIFMSNDDTMMKSINCSIMNEKYKPVNKPVRLVL